MPKNWGYHIGYYMCYHMCYYMEEISDIWSDIIIDCNYPTKQGNIVSMLNFNIGTILENNNVTITKL